MSSNDVPASRGDDILSLMYDIVLFLCVRKLVPWGPATSDGTLSYGSVVMLALCDGRLWDVCGAVGCLSVAPKGCWR